MTGMLISDLRWSRLCRIAPKFLLGAVLSVTLGGCPNAADTTGLDGATDSTDQTSRVGPQGAVGATGPAGQDGAAGVQGVQGLPGADGANGVNGQDGATGAQGPQGAQGAQGPAGAAGANGANGSNGANGTNGANGADGADGQLRVYGNGIDGARVISFDTDISSEAISHQYTDFTIDAGQMLIVPSGCTIRCTGTFINNGTIVVMTGARGGQPSGVLAIAEPGLALSSPRTASNAQVQAGVLAAPGGVSGMAPFTARWNLQPGFDGGGGGAATGAGNGGDGGGTLVILALGNIENGSTGEIRADGQSFQGGGGGGGVVVLASRTSVTNAGVINARGGIGQDAADLGGGLTFVAASGGGGGGIVRIVSPANTLTGVASVSAGAGGAALLEQTTLTTANILGGGAGGACFGNGGSSGTSTFVPNAPPIGNVNLNAPAAAAQDGFFEATTVDPTALL